MVYAAISDVSARSGNFAPISGLLTKPSSGAYAAETAKIPGNGERGYLFRPNGELEGSHRGIFRPGSGDPAFLFKPSDLAPEVIGFGLIPADDPNGPLIHAQDDLDQRPTPERCIEAKPFHLQRTRF